MGHSGVVKLRARMDALAHESREDSGRRCAIKTAVVEENADFHGMRHSIRARTPRIRRHSWRAKPLKMDGEAGFVKHGRRRCHSVRSLDRDGCHLGLGGARQAFGIFARERELILFSLISLYDQQNPQEDCGYIDQLQQYLLYRDSDPRGIHDEADYKYLLNYRAQNLQPPEDGDGLPGMKSHATALVRQK